MHMNTKEVQKPRYINVHCHLLNFEFLPDSFFGNCGVPESFIKSRFTIFLIKLIKPYLLLRNKIKGYLPLYLIDTCISNLKREITEIRKIYSAEMYQAKFILATPLMMDVEIASSRQKPECPYRLQIQIISELVAKRYFWELEYFIMMPFIMFDPRREIENFKFPAAEMMARDAIKKAIEDYGFLGVKMYPALGYHPDPESIYNPESVNKELREIYKYCDKNRIPITTHCSRDGAYSSELIRSRQSVKFLSSPLYWEKVLNDYPDINLNLAHFGGGWDFLRKDDRDFESWTREILKLMKKYKNVYADVSSHSGALMSKISNNYFKDIYRDFEFDPKQIKKVNNKEYFKILNCLLDDESYRYKILFGTDWPMTRHSWYEKTYVQFFIDGLGKDNFEQIALKNPLKFLFPEDKVPERIEKFHKENECGKEAINWLNTEMEKLRKN